MEVCSEMKAVNSTDKKHGTVLHSQSIFSLLLLIFSLSFVVSCGSSDETVVDSDVADLSSLVLSEGTLSPVYDAAAISYTARVGNKVATIEVTPTVADAGATISINGFSITSGTPYTVSLGVGDNIIPVYVEAADGVTNKTYTVTVTREDSITYSVGGTVSGLNGTVILQNNLADDLSISVDGSFTFTTLIADGANYAVTVSSSPAGQSCIVTNGTGSIAGVNVTNVSVACSDVVSTPAGIFIEPMSLYATSATALGDVDGDGDLDLVAAWGETTVWLNNGMGGLIDSGQVLSSSVGVLKLGDVDADGDLDLVMTGTNNTLWLNDGHGVFSDSGQTLGNGATDISLGDLDGDGDLDLVVAHEYGYNGPHNVWLNNGAGVFSYESGLDFGTWERIQSITLGDVDGDGDLDLVEVCAYCPERIWLNNGGGGFFDSGQELGTDNTRSVVLGDIDDDGDLDMVAANGNGGNPVWLNDGNGIFTDSGQSLVGGGFGSAFLLTLGDVDNDGDLDLVEASGHGDVNTFNSLWLNDGNGIFTDSGQSFNSANAAGSALFGDMDSDGDLDLVMDHAWGTMSVWINSGVGIFTDSIQFLESNETQSVVLGDIDGDGDLDLVEGNYAESAYYDKKPNTVKFNNGNGSFTDSGQLLGSAETNSVALGDVDGDNDLDLVAGNNVGSNKVWLNDGTGVFTDSGQALSDSYNSTTWSVALGDVDGDGDLDLVAGNLGKRNTTWFNDGAGTFTISQYLGEISGSSSTRSILMGDVDGDGDLDLVEGNSRRTDNEPNTVWLNDGAGLFTDSGQVLGSNNTYALALGDVDGDGDLDLVEGNYGSEPNTVWFNNGAGIFTDSGQTLGSSPTNSLTLGDVDNDGDLDLVAGNYLEPDTVWLNSGTGIFTDSGHTLGYHFVYSEYLGTQSVTLGDVDADGDLDLITGTHKIGGAHPNTINLNQAP